MSEPLATALAEALELLVRRLVRKEVRLRLDECSPRWLTVAQAAVRIGIGESAVRERIRRGLLAGRKWEGRWYVASADVDSAIERGTPSATVPVHSGRDMAPAALERPEAVAINRR
jgi:Helix-turn-helix domain